jgi:tetratricopeptide (TPR) repeat protein
MAIKGSLKEAGLADVCQLLALGGKSGCLAVSDGSRFGQIYFESGRICFARIVNRRDRIGDLLLRDGLLDSEQLESVLRLQAAEPERRLGELLVARGQISREDLTRYVRLQIEEAIYHLFTWSRGSFFFEVDARATDADIFVSINPEMLLLEAARRVDEWSQIEKKIPSLDLLFDVERERLESAGVELTAEQQQLVPLLDGTRTVVELSDASGLSEFDTGKALYGLIQAGFAHRVGRRTVESELSRVAQVQERRNLGVAFFRTNMLKEALREFERVLELDEDDHTARFFTALVHIRMGDYRSATRELRTLLERRGPHYGAFINLAVALRLLGRADDALLVIEAAEAERPGRSATLLARAATLLSAGRYAQASQALGSYRRTLGDQRPPPEYFHAAALNEAICADADKAAETLAEGLTAWPDSAPLLLLEGLLAERRGDLDSADRSYRRAIREDATLAQAHKSLGDVAYRRGAHQEALHCYLRATELAPRLGDDVYARLGNLMYKSRRTDAAVEYWRQALELNPANTIVRNNLEIVAHAAG